MDERITTLHPLPGKRGVSISKAKYDITRQAICDTFRERGELTHTQLAEEVNRKLAGKFDGSITWYVTTVKLDLEARGLIQRIPKTMPPRLRWNENGS
jgi:hypothetical protein